MSLSEPVKPPGAAIALRYMPTSVYPVNAVCLVDHETHVLHQEDIDACHAIAAECAEG
ncbi:hypothetical protein ACVMB2_006330 [Sinorhizobium meliloti]